MLAFLKKLGALFTVANLEKYGKVFVTILGPTLIFLNEVLPLVPPNWQHWVTGAIAVLTLIGRDLTGIVDMPLSPKSTPKSAPAQ